MAYAQKRLGQPHKYLVGLQTDVRAAFIGAKLNPMLAVAVDDLVADEEALLGKLRSR